MLLDLLELASNKTLEYDPNTRARLEKLQGKTMTLRIKPIDKSFSLTPYREGLEFSAATSENADVVLTATISAIVKISRDGMDNAELEPGELEMSGDPIVGQRFAQVISELDINWQELLTEQFGESPAHIISFAAGHAKGFVSESRDKVKEVFSDLITEDLGVTVRQQEVDSFLDNVDTLRADTDRLLARIKRLQNSV